MGNKYFEYLEAQEQGSL